jgi:hypothetical protein
MRQHDDGQDDLAALGFFETNRSGSDDNSSVERQALDFSVAGDDSDQGASVDALWAQELTNSQDTATERDALRSATGVATDDAQADAASDYLARVTNPSGTVSVTALLDGRILRVELSPKVASMTESALADEILVIADLARQKGLAKQRAFLVEVMRASRLDEGAAGHDLIEESLDMPTTEQAEAARAEVFATRYAAASTD